MESSLCPPLRLEKALLSVQEGPKPDSMSMGSAHPEAAYREAQAEGGQEQEVAGGTGGFTRAGAEGGAPHHSMGGLMAEGQDPASVKEAAQHAAPVTHPARPLPHLPLMREV